MAMLFIAGAILYFSALIWTADKKNNGWIILAGIVIPIILLGVIALL